MTESEHPSCQAAEEVLKALGTDRVSGLLPSEAATRLRNFGRNELTAATPVPRWRKLVVQFQDPLVYLLLGAAAVSLGVWAVEGAHGVPFDALVVSLIVIANAALGYAQRAKAEQAVAALERMTATVASVLRGGESHRIPVAEIVRGDVLLLAAGDAVGADARVLSASNLATLEAALTGESEPVSKNSQRLPELLGLGDRVNMVYKGTAVAQGIGRAVVVATGMSTEVGHIARLLESTQEEKTPLERELDVLGRTLGKGVLGIALVVIGAVLYVSPPHSARAVIEALLLGIALAVAAVPEGLPAILSLVLAIGVQRMAERRAIVKKLASVETLGATSVICSDKTGTLTRNEMTIVQAVVHSGQVEITGSGYEPEGRLLAGGEPLVAGALLEEIRAVLSLGSLVNDSVLSRGEAGWEIQGDPTEAALLVAERKAGFTAERERRFERLAELPFTSERKLMSTVAMDRSARRLLLATKGAPDVLIERCVSERVGGESRPLGEERRREWRAAVDRLSGKALRALGVAYRELPGLTPPDTGAAGASEDLERDLVYAGTVGILDPPRAEAMAAIAEARAAGVRTIMLTGDHPRTAQRIAESLGLIPEGGAVCTGLELERMDDRTLRAVVRETSVFARVSPEHKLRIVDALQAEGAVVAMTGDGVNDAPALKSADIGIAMGINGTEVTKEAAKMILADDNFATIVVAIREGRLIFDNIVKFLRYLLSSNIGEVLTVFIGIIGGGWFGLVAPDGSVLTPLLATQILWINLLTDAAPALALGVEQSTRDVMARPPRAMGSRIIDRALMADVLIVGVTMALATLLTFDIELPAGFVEGSASATEARTAAFTVLVLAQLFNCFNSRSDQRSAFHELFENRLLWGAVALSALLQVLVVSAPALNAAFGTQPLGAETWGLCVLMASSVLWVSELRKAMRRRRLREK
jgi:Ca2+-transporting ATPase